MNITDRALTSPEPAVQPPEEVAPVRLESIGPHSLAAQTGDLPPLPEVAWKVLQITSDLYWNACDFEKVVTHDQALTAKILKISNSAFFGLRGTVSTVSQAAVILGNRRLRSLVVAASLEGVFGGRTLNGERLWEHSLAVALATGQLALKRNFPEPEEAFVAGLMHDIGKAVLDGNREEVYTEILKRANLEHIQVIDLEREMLGFDHTQVGSLLATKWNLAPHIEEVVRYHHSPSEASRNPELCAIVSLADAVCVKKGVGPVSLPDLDLNQLEATRMLGIGEDQLDAVINEVQLKLEEDRRMFGLRR